MKQSPDWKWFLCIGAFVLSVLPVRAQHSHLNAGAFALTQDAQLYFVNGANFVTNSGYVLGLTEATNGQYAGYYHGTITPTALPATGDFGGPAFGHAALGSFLVAQVETLTGPVGGSFGFWEETDVAPHFSVVTGTTNGTQRFNLSEGDGAAGADPFGHIHGRRFTATLPGLYTVGFRILDISSNGTGGGPIHTPSELFHINMQAGITIARMTLTTNGVDVTFAALNGRTYYLEATTELTANTAWQPVSNPITGNSRLHTISDLSATGQTRFYRLRTTTP